MTSPLVLATCTPGTSGSFVLIPTPTASQNGWGVPVLLAAYRQANPKYNCWLSANPWLKPVDWSSGIMCGAVNNGTCPSNSTIADDLTPFISSYGKPLTISLDLNTTKVASWDGFGTGLAWWGQMVGNSSFEALHTSLYYSTTPTISVNVVPTPAAAGLAAPASYTSSVPGLGFNIVRYNIGGTGAKTDAPGVEQYSQRNATTGVESASFTPDEKTWWYLTPGFWIKNDSTAWDWSRDFNQRSLLKSIYNSNIPNVWIEFFSGAPMWWMTDANSSLGGNLLPNMTSLFPYYVAKVVNQSIADWKVNVSSVEILNEPSGGWWNFPNAQEGMNVKTSTLRLQLLNSLRKSLNQTFNLTNVNISGCDENSPVYAIWNDLANVLATVDKFNIHSYNNNDALRGLLSSKVPPTKPFWQSEYGDGDQLGITLGYTIAHDINIMNIRAWMNWQVVDQGGWGAVFIVPGANSTDPGRGQITKINPKYHIIGQYSRYIRPKDVILGSTDSSNTVVAFDGSKYKIIVGNYASQRPVTLNLTSIAVKRGVPYLTAPLLYSFTSPTNGSFSVTGSWNVTNNLVTFVADAFAVYSVIV
ncbi:hypothetical protein HDU79_011363 [Rhizoclosmatium sp. JEL0117]|nr:hypothetical protein HDU79_011363 [Rhizoclosmatium sp. JEL0117]